jgi:PKD repeat protein
LHIGEILQIPQKSYICYPQWEMGWYTLLNRDMFAVDLKTTLMKTTANKIIISILASFVLCLNANALSDALKVKIVKGTSADETVIRFLPLATTGFDGSYDAYKLFSTSTIVPAIFTKADPITELSINALPALEAQNDVALFMHIKVAGIYTLQAIEMGTGFQPGIGITLEDLQTGLLYSFRNGQSVTLPMTVNTVSSPNRFVVHIAPAMTVLVSDAVSNGSSTGSISLSKPGNTSWNCELMNTAGTVVSIVSGINDSTTITSLPAGTYTVLASSSSTLPDSVPVTISEPAPVVVLTAAFTSSKDTALLSEAAIGFTNNSTGAVYYSWDFGDGTGTDSISPFHLYTVSGNFNVTLVVSDSAGNSALFAKMITVDTLPVVYVPTPVVLTAAFSSSKDTALLSEAAIGFTNNSTGAVYYSWDFGDGTGTDSISPFHQYTMSGIFTVSLVVADSAGNSAFYSKVITVNPDLTTGIGSTENTASAHVYQNEGALRIMLSSDAPAGMMVQVYNNMGQSIASFSASNATGLSESVSPASSGTYIVRSLINNKLQSQQISFVK